MALSTCVLMPYLQNGAAFFNPERNTDMFPSRVAIPVPGIAWLQACARTGCELCTILIASADVSFLSFEVGLTIADMRLKRAILDPHQSVQFVVGMDDCSRTFFYRIPCEWRTEKLRLSKLDEPAPEREVIKTWVQDCLSNHKNCTTDAGAGSFCPTRLLDLYAFEKCDDVRLAPNLQSAEWAALSHCWGPAALHPVTTTDASLGERCTRIPFSLLSLTFQDAVKTTRHLGIRYLWIDSLCIVQDSHADWEREADMMDQVYGGSVVTLCALSSENSTQGCRVNAKGSSLRETIPRYADFPIGDMRIRFFESEPTYWHRESGDDPYKFEGFSRTSRSPLNTRAWTLQERELSTRKILFSENMLLWECKTVKASSELPWLERKFDTEEIPRPVLLPGESDLFQDGPAIQRDRWYSLVEDYSSRYMTNEADKLVALRGLIRRQRHSFSAMEEVAGMWKRHLPAALLWQSWPYGNKTSEGLTANCQGAFYPRRPMAERAPSWSWASMDGLISYQSQRLTAGVAASNSNNSSDTGDISTTSSVEVLARVVNCSPGVSPTGSETSVGAKMTVIGRLASVRSDLEPLGAGARIEEYTASKTWSDDIRALRSGAGEIVGAFLADIVAEAGSLDRLFCLAIQKEAYISVLSEPAELHGSQTANEDEFDSHGLIMGLALVAVGEGKYRRAGLTRWVKPALFAGVKDRTLCLV